MEEFEKLENFLTNDDLPIEGEEPKFTPPTFDTPPEQVESTGVEGYITGLVDMGLFELPENYELKDLDDAKLQELIDYNDEQREVRAFQNLLARIPDNRIKEIIEYAEKGGKYADIDKFFQLQKEEEIIPTSDKKAYVQSVYMKKGIPEKQAKTLVENLELDEELDTEFEKLENERVALTAKQKADAAKAAADAARIEKEAQDKWSKSFQTELTKSGWTKKKQQEIVEAFNPLALQSGGSIPAWRYKMHNIQENPAHFLQFLDLLTAYDPTKGFAAIEEREEASATTKVSKSLLDKINQHSKGTTLKGRASDEKPFVPVDPRTQNVKILK